MTNAIGVRTPASSSNQSSSTPSAREPVAQPRAPGVVARAAGERDVGAEARGGDRGVGDVAAEPRHERVGLRGRVDGVLADEVDERLAEAEGPHQAQRYPPALSCPTVTEHTGLVGDCEVFWREAPTPAGRAPVLYLHGVPTDGDDWLPFLERTAAARRTCRAIGRSGKRGDLDYSMEGLGRFVEAFADARGLERVRLVVHDWGSVGLLFAMRAPERIERLVIIDAVPLLPGYRWHRIARIWRRRGLGELFMGGTSRARARACSRPT